MTADGAGQRRAAGARAMRSARRPLTDDEREARRQQMRAAWRDGRFVGRRAGMHPRHWTPAQDQALAALAGTRPVDEIADELERRFYLRRTTASIRIQAKRLGLSLRCGGLSMRELTALFGVDHRVVRRRWIADGHLAARRWQGRGPHDGWWVEQAELERFVRECGWLVDVARMQRGHRLTRLAETAQRSDPWIVGLDALSDLLGLAPVNVKRWLRRGLIPHERRPVGGSVGTICVRGRDIGAIRAAIAEAQSSARRVAHATFLVHRRAESQRALDLTRERADRLIGSCKNGHARSVETTRVSEVGKLTCLACRRDRLARGRAG